MRRVESEFPGCAAIVVVLFVLFFLALGSVGCGGVSPAQYLAYDQEEQRCERNEDAIVARDSTEEEDARDLATERTRCRDALATILGRSPTDAGTP